MNRGRNGRGLAEMRCGLWVEWEVFGRRGRFLATFLALSYLPFRLVVEHIKQEKYERVRGGERKQGKHPALALLLWYWRLPQSW